MQKLWGGRFEQKSAALLDSFNASLDFDKELYAQDIQGSKIHARMLAKQGILTDAEASAIIAGLEAIAEQIQNGAFVFDIAHEDIHMAIESALIERIGDVGKKLHTARSRNDQVALDFRLYVLQKNLAIRELLFALLDSIVSLAKVHTTTLMPGMTHLQHAQPVNLGFHLMAYSFMFWRDIVRLSDDYVRNNYCPLGSAALAGSPYPIDRDFTAQNLGFAAPTANAMDSVSDRDFALDMHYSLSMLAMHISRFAEELVVWSSSEFGFVRFSDAYATGSSIMPQKKNPDVAELLRGKTGRIYGNLMALLVVMKGLPLAYNKDTQEDKEGLFDSVRTMELSLRILKELLETSTFCTENMHKACAKGHLCATDLADFLVRTGIAFRDAHHITGKVVAFAESNHLDISELSAQQLCALDSRIPADAVQALSLQSSMNARNCFGGTATSRVIEQITLLENQLASAKEQWQKESACRK
ncbi:MAG: argininosuccinate lyase [Helicobacter sp.]|nr:argininosuccinate lyase [Helicobacter sp.]